MSQVNASREKSARNAAAVRYLRHVKDDRKVTNEQIAERSGINFEMVKRLMLNKADFTMDTFLSIAEALGVDDSEALAALSEIVRKKDI